jgi:hypothetical protein
VLSGLDGVAASTGDAREPSSYALSMFVRGTDADGFVPEDRDAWAKLRANLDDLLHLFLRTDSLIRVSEVVESDGVPGTVLDVLPYTEREFYGKVLDTIEPELEAGAIARFGVVFSNPGVYWRDPVPQDFTQVVVSGTQYEVPGLEGASGPVSDAILTLHGPADAGVAIYDVTTGAFVRLATALSATDVWRVNVGTWSSRVAVGLNLDSADVTGTDATADTDQGGQYASLLRLMPTRQTDGTRTVKVKVVGGGFTGATALSLRTRRAYL